MHGKRVSIIHTEIVRDGSFIFKDRYMKTPEIAAKMMADYIKGADKEKIYVVCLNQRCEPVSLELVAIGTSDRALAGMKEIFKTAVLTNAVSIIVVHDRISGCTEPSAPGIRLTKRLREAGELLGIKLADHIILGDHGAFYSFHEKEGWE